MSEVVDTEGPRLPLARLADAAARMPPPVFATTSETARLFYEHAGYRTMLACEEAEPGLVRTTLQRRF